MERQPMDESLKLTRSKYFEQDNRFIWAKDLSLSGVTMKTKIMFAGKFLMTLKKQSHTAKHARSYQEQSKQYQFIAGMGLLKNIIFLRKMNGCNY